MEANGLTTDDYVSVETQARYFISLTVNRESSTIDDRGFRIVDPEKRNPRDRYLAQVIAKSIKHNIF